MTLETEAEWHAITRARERYGIELTPRDILEMCERCRKSEGYQEERSDGKTLHSLIHNDRILWVVYRPSKPPSPGTIVTILPPSEAHNKAARDAGQMRRRMRAGR